MHREGNNILSCLLTVSEIGSVDRAAFVSSAMCGPGQPFPYPFTSPPSTLSFSIFYFFPFLLASSIHLFSCFFIPSHSTRMVPLRFQAGCHRRRLNLALVFCVFILCYMYFLVKDACLFLLYLDSVLSSCVIVVSPCCRCSIHFPFWVAAEQKGGQG